MASMRHRIAKPGEAGVSSDPKSNDRLDVQIKLVCGGLTKVKSPIVVGARYDGLAFAGPTKLFDRALDNWLTRAVDLGILGSALGQLMPVNLAQFHKADKLNAQMLILAGMGEPGRFAQDGVRFIVSNIVVTIKAIAANEFATPLIGTRRNELPVGDAVRGLVLGIADGYDRARAIADSVTESREAFRAVVRQPLTVTLVHDDDKKIPQINEALQLMAKNDELSIRLAVVDGGTVERDPEIELSPGESEPEHVTYLRVTQSKSAKAGLVRAGSATSPKRKPRKAAARATIDPFPTVVFEFSALSDVAVVPQRELEVNAHLLHDLAERMTMASSADDGQDQGDLPPADRQDQCDFFTNLVIPDDFRKLIEGPASVTLEVDDTTAVYPWEMAGYKRFAGVPLFLGTNVAVSRQFRTLLSPPPTSPPALNSTLSALIIADPGSGALALPGARDEGLKVVEVLKKVQQAWGDQYQIDITLRMGPPDDPTVKQQLLKAKEKKENEKTVVTSAKPCDPLELAMLLVNNQYDVVHYAGHGMSDPVTGQTGWIFAEDCVLSAKEIFRIRQVPRLVFANACFSAVTTDVNKQREHMAGLAQAFFGRGIPNYIGAGWTVDDQSAAECARWFYARLLGLTGPNDDDGVDIDQTGATIGRALQQARQIAQGLDPQSSSWGAYQHYGHVGDRLVSIANPQEVASANRPPCTATRVAEVTIAKATTIKATTITLTTKTAGSGANDGASGSPGEDPNLVYVNGIDFNTGQYAVKPRSIDDIAERVLHGTQDFAKTRGHKSRALPADTTDSLEDVGWGIIFPENTPNPIRAALKPLIEFRGKRAGKLLKDKLDYKSGEQVRDWLARRQLSPGNVTPNKVPYYLLLVGGPDQIPFEFQYLLGIEYAVGRLAFDAADDYTKYVDSIIAYESGKSVPNEKKISYWGTRHLGDGATRLSSTFLLDPLINGRPDDGVPPVSQQVGFAQECFLAKNATKANLLATLRAPKPPALLFTASHGMIFNSGQAEQAASQGALLCQDWPGFGTMKPEHFLAAADVADDANVNGVVAFLFACFGAGTPDKDQFVDNLAQAGSAPPLAPKPFMAALPRRLLTHPKGSALAVIGHIDRAWGFSMQAPNVSTPQIETFRNSLVEILKGKPLGSTISMRFGSRFADLSAVLLSATSPTASGQKLSDRDLVNAWIERNDAQNYVLLGDPAVRIRNDRLT